MKMLTFSRRTAREILRDPLNFGFGIGFPVVLLLLLSAIQANIPVNLFEISNLAPGIAVFALSFLTLFSATLVARDRESAFLSRLYTTPLTAQDYILGYILPMLPIALVQSAVCYAAAMALGLAPTGRIFAALAMILPISLFYISMGLLLGSVLNVRQAGSICGALFTNVSAWLSGTWFDLELVGGAFRDIAFVLPFAHAVELERGLLHGELQDMRAHFLWVAGYALAAFAGAVWVFLRQMRRQ